LNWRRCCNPIIASKDSNEIASSAPPPLFELDTVVTGSVTATVTAALALTFWARQFRP
jgi:hypothetical protein